MSALPSVPIERIYSASSYIRAHSPRCISAALQAGTHRTRIHVHTTTQTASAANQTLGYSVAAELADRGNNCYRSVTNARQPAFAIQPLRRSFPHSRSLSFSLTIPRELGDHYIS